jgi:hypothetical protein
MSIAYSLKLIILFNKLMDLFKIRINKKSKMNMKNQNSNEFYLRRKAQQLKQWGKVLDKIILRAEISNGNNKSIIIKHINKIQSLKLKTENILEQLKKAENERWDSSNINLEKNFENLRKAFLESSKSLKRK